MKTIVWGVDKLGELSESYPQIQNAARWLQQNEVIAFPTETVYGLGANALSDEAVDKIFKAKGRPSDNPLIVHIAEIEQLDDLTEGPISDKAKRLMEHFWPGPLTIIFPKKEGVSEKVTAGLETVAVRMPSHPVAHALLREVSLPIAAPSANLSGKPSPTTAQHVFEDLNGRIIGIIDGGATGVGLESTVVDCTAEVPVILRPGGVTKEEMETIVGPVIQEEELKSEVPKSPGMKYTHYAPKAPLVIVNGSVSFVQNTVKEKQQQGLKVGVLTTIENGSEYGADVVIPCGTRRELESVANRLYDVLRLFDQHDVDLILSESFPQEGVGKAIMNRLLKAAGNQVIEE